MKKVLIQIGTEFHYMVALSLIEKYYDDPSFEIHFLVSKNPDGKSRMEDVKPDERFTYHVVPYSHNKNVVYDKVIEFMDFVKENEFFHFISFLYHDPLFVYLTYYFRKKGTVSYLAPDGLAAYARFTKSTLRSRVLNSLNSYKFFKRHGMPFYKFWLTSWDFGKNGDYDYIYAYSKTLPYVPSNKKIIEIDYTLSEESLDRLKKVFAVDFSSYPSLEKTVLIINHRHNLHQYEPKLIEMIREILPDYTILFKKHPNQSAANLSYLSKYDEVYKINEVFPVELLIASLKDSVIISPYSTSMLYYNPFCSYLWTYPIVTQSKELKKPVERHNPKEYIHVMSDFDELKENLLKIRNAGNK